MKFPRSSWFAVLGAAVLAGGAWLVYLVGSSRTSAAFADPVARLEALDRSERLADTEMAALVGSGRCSTEQLRQLRATQKARHSQRMHILDDTLSARNAGSTLAAPATQLSQGDSLSPDKLQAAEKQQELAPEQKTVTDEMRAFEAQHRGDSIGLSDAMARWRHNNVSRLAALDRLAGEASKAGGARSGRANASANQASSVGTPATNALADSIQQNADDLQELQIQTKDLSPEAKTVAFAAWRAKSMETLAQLGRNVDEERRHRESPPGQKSKAQ